MSTTRSRSATEPRSLVALGLLLGLCIGGGALIGTVFAGQASVYTDYDLPPWAPPSWLFGPAWTTLYALMAVSAWLVWREPSRFRSRALIAFALQLVLNFLWTPAFFGVDSPLIGFVTIVAVLLAVGWWLAEAWRIRLVAGALQVPYILWVGLATGLNLAIVVMN